MIKLNRRRQSASAKVSSADSILAMFRSFASSNHAAGHHYQQTRGNSADTSPTPSSPRDDGSLSSLCTQASGSISLSRGDSPLFYGHPPIESPSSSANINDVLPRKSSLSNSNSSSASSLHQSVHQSPILLEIPSANHCFLSPIRELPTPLPSPAITPIMNRARKGSPIDFAQDNTQLQVETKATKDAPVFNPNNNRRYNFDDSASDDDGAKTIDVSVDLHRSNQDVDDDQPLMLMVPAPAPSASTSNKLGRRISIQINDELLIDSDNDESNAPKLEMASPTRPNKLVIPTLTIQEASPTKTRTWFSFQSPVNASQDEDEILVKVEQESDKDCQDIYEQDMFVVAKNVADEDSSVESARGVCLRPLPFLGSPPPQRASIGETSFAFPNKQQQRKLLKDMEKPNSLDLAFVPPMITVSINVCKTCNDTYYVLNYFKVTCNMSENDSDSTTDVIHGASGASRHLPPHHQNLQHLVPPSTQTGMCYLSPFSRQDNRATSESNLSSSGLVHL